MNLEAILGLFFGFIAGTFARPIADTVFKNKKTLLNELPPKYHSDCGHRRKVTRGSNYDMTTGKPLAPLFEYESNCESCIINCI